MAKINNIIFFFFIFLLFLNACQDKRLKESYYKNSKQIKEQFKYFTPADTSSYEYILFYSNGNIKEKGTVRNFQREGNWQEWYEDGLLRREIEYKQNIPNIYAKNRKLPEIIFSSDSLKVGVETKIKVLNIYPNEDLPTSIFKIRSLPKDPCYDFAIIPLSTDSLYFFYFKPFHENINIDLEGTSEKNKMLIISRKPVYDK